LSAADVHLVSLRPELEGLIVPSKFYGICAAGRPTLFIGDGDGEIARLIRRRECGRTVPVGDGTALAKAIIDLAADQAECWRLGQRARQAFDAEFDELIAVARWDKLLLQVSGGHVFTVQGEATRAQSSIVRQERVNAMAADVRADRLT
jgi:hypothetical protein